MAWLADLDKIGVVDESAFLTGTGGLSFGCDVVALLLVEDVRDGGGGGLGGLGGGGGFGLISASQSMFLLGWLCMRSRVLAIFDVPASAILAAFSRSSVMDGIAMWRQLEFAKKGREVSAWWAVCRLPLRCHSPAKVGIWK